MSDTLKYTIWKPTFIQNRSISQIRAADRPKVAYD